MMFRALVSLSLLAVCGRISVAAKETPIVQVEEGQLRGIEQTCVSGKKYYSFLGIPFAKPPVGPQRFKDPQIPDKWNGVFNATKERPMCIHWDRSDLQFKGSEDCLFLNVHTPVLPINDGQNNTGSKLLPVMIWISGRGVDYGAGNCDDNGPDFFMEEDVIIVIINFRSNIFGFFFLKEAAPANVGLKDQVRAFEWVKNNILPFNGDPDKITIFGEGAGAACVDWHTWSPMSEGLFHRAIIQSAAFLNPWAHTSAPYETSKQLAQAVGCTDDDDKQVVQCLCQVPVEKLLWAYEEQVLNEPIQRLTGPQLSPAIDVQDVTDFMANRQEIFSRQGGIHNSVSTMIGLNANAWTLKSAPIFSQTINEKDPWDSLENLIIPETQVRHDVNISEVKETLQQFFMNGKPLTNDNLEGFETMCTDLLFGAAIYKRLAYTTDNTFVYSLILDGELNYAKNLFHLNFKGTCEGDGVGYLFQTTVSPNVSPNSTDFRNRQRMVRMWSNFAKCGDPTPNEDPLIGEKWLPFTPNDTEYLEIGNKLELKKGFNKGRMEFWNNFYKTFGAKQENNASCSCSI